MDKQKPVTYDKIIFIILVFPLWMKNSQSNLKFRKEEINIISKQHNDHYDNGNGAGLTPSIIIINVPAKVVWWDCVQIQLT